MSTTETYYERRTSSVTARILGEGQTQGGVMLEQEFFGELIFRLKHIYLVSLASCVCCTVYLSMSIAAKKW